MIHAFLEKIEILLAKAALGGCTLLILLGAIARTAGAPLIWAVDIALLLFAWCCMLGADLALRRNRHIEIDVLIRRFPAMMRRALAFAWLALIAGFLVILIVYGVRLTFLNVERPLGDIELSYAWVTLSIPVGGALMLWTVVHRVVNVLRGRETLSLEGFDGRVL